MSLDIKIRNAIETAVQKSGQPATVANRIIAWFEAINDGNEDINDRPHVDRRLESLYDVTEVDLPDPLDDNLSAIFGISPSEKRSSLA